MENLSLFENTYTKLHFVYVEDIDLSYLEKLACINAYYNLINSLTLYPFLYIKKLRRELSLKDTVIKLSIKKEKIKYKEDLQMLKNLTEKELKSILYSDKISDSNEAIVFLEEFNNSVLSVYLKTPKKQAIIIDKKTHPLKTTAIEYILKKVNFEKIENPEKIMVDTIKKVINVKKHLNQILEDVANKYPLKSKVFNKEGITIKIDGQNKVKISKNIIASYYDKSCKEYYLNLEDVPSNTYSIKEEIKFLKKHLSSILERNNTKSISNLPQEDKDDFIYTYIKFKKLKERLKIEKLREKKNDRKTTYA